MTELAEEFHGGAGKLQLVGGAVLKPHAERRTLAPHDTLDGKGIKAGTFEGSYRVAGSRQAAHVLPITRN